MTHRRKVNTVKQLAKHKTGPRSRAKISVNKADPVTGERKDYASSEPLSSQVPDASYAFTLRKYVNEDEDDSAEIKIINEYLWDLLKELLGHYPHHLFLGSPVTMESPFKPLVLYWDELEQAARDTPKNDNDRQARSDLKLLLDTISSSSGYPKLDKYFRARDSNKELNAVTFDTLWTIFLPGSLVYGQPFQGQHQIFIVQDSDKTWPDFRSTRVVEHESWDLLCWTYDWDGNKFRRMCLRLEFEYFDGHKLITSLPFYPWKLNEQRDIIRDSLRKQGVEYRRICTAAQGSRMFEYNGEAILVKKGFSGVQGDEDKVGFVIIPRKSTEI